MVMSSKAPGSDNQTPGELCLQPQGQAREGEGEERKRKEIEE